MILLWAVGLWLIGPGCAEGNFGEEDSGPRVVSDGDSQPPVHDTSEEETGVVDATDAADAGDTGLDADTGEVGDADADIQDTADTTPPDDTDTGQDPDVGPCRGLCTSDEYCANGQCVDACAEATAQCGTVRAAGLEFDCGSCGSKSYCAQNSCQNICTNSGADCGEVFWGGVSAMCGGCPSRKSCVQNRCTGPGWRSIAGGFRHSCGTKSDGNTYCWGADGSGQLGNGSGSASTTPTEASTRGTALVVRSNHLHSCATLQSGEMQCWGINNFGQIGDGTTQSPAASPADVQGLSSGQLPAAGDLHSCVVLQSGEARCWGYDGFGLLGNGQKMGVAEPRPVDVQGLKDVVDISSGGSHTCALRSDGTVWCWGNGSKGSIGQGYFMGSSTPEKVDKLTDAIAIAAGAKHSCAATRDGEVWCWGKGADYQLGNRNQRDTAKPVKVQKNSPWRAVGVIAGKNHSCARTKGGEVRCWGGNGSGQLGTGTMQSAQQPLVVQGAGGSGRLTGVVALGAGQEHTCAITDDGSAYCWGNNDKGQLGNASTTAANNPVEVK